MISFHPEIRDEDLIGFEIHCHETDPDCRHENTMYPDYESGVAAFRSRQDRGEADPHCCGLYARWSIDPDDLTVTLCSSNARDVLDVLGHHETCGSMTIDDLRGRILVARALAADEDRQEHRHTGTAGATVIIPARQAGYLTGVLDRLDRLADHCETIGRALVCH